jgi:ABC-type lipoprotein release transport system permease subunit
MHAIMMLARSELRRRWRSVVVLTVLVGFAGAVVLALWAGARRTDTSLQRFDEASLSASVEITAGDTTPAERAELRRTPGVAAVAEVSQFPLAMNNRFNAVAGQVDGRFGTVVDRARVIEGRLADQSKVDELTMGERLAEQLHVGVGDVLHFESYSPEDIAEIRLNNAELPAAHGPDVSFRIVGIVRRPLDLGGRGAAGGVLVPTIAFTREYRDRIGTFAGSILRVRTERGAADLPAVSRAARRIFGDDDVFAIQALTIEGEGAQDAIDVATVGLYVAAAVAAVVGLVGLGIALSREIALVDGDQQTLRALGMRPRARVLAAAAIGAPVAAVGAILALVGAVLMSPLFPIGVGALAEPDPGLDVDAFALALGAIGVLVAVVVVAVLAAARLARGGSSARGRRRPARAAAMMSDLGAPPPVSVGVQFALDQGRARPALPVRSSLVGATFGILVIVGVLVFSSSLDHLVSTPSAYGWNWDTTAGDLSIEPPENDCGPITTVLVDEPVVSDVAAVCTSAVTIAGRPITAWGFQQLRGRIEPLIVEGRAPTGPDEVALGRETMDLAGVGVGDHVRIQGPGRSSTFRVVGQAVVPGLGDPSPPADSATFESAALARLGDANGGWNLVVRLAPGVDRARAMRVLRKIGGNTGEPLSPRVPTEIDRVRRIDGLPVALAVFVSVVAVVAVGFALVTTVRRRRRALAVLKTLGFGRGQVRAAVAWQATTVVAVGLLLGIPLGLVAGRLVWGLVADQLGVSGDPTWPVVGILLLVPIAVLLVNLVAALPARRAARTLPAVVLRSE